MMGLALQKENRWHAGRDRKEIPAARRRIHQHSVSANAELQREVLTFL